MSAPDTETLRREYQAVKAYERAFGALGATSKQTRELHATSCRAISAAAAQLGMDPQALAQWLDNGRLADIILAATHGARPLIYADPGAKVDECIQEAMRWAEQEHRRITRELAKVEKQFRVLRQELSAITGGRHFWEDQWRQHRADTNAAGPKL